MPDAQSDPFYDADTIFQENGPIDPRFIADAIHALMRAMPLDTAEPDAVQQRHMTAALIALAATNPRDPIEVMLAVQAVSAYQAACACWRIGMNLRSPRGDSTRHISAAATAARTFDSMLRALERRQAKPLLVPVGRPASRVWNEDKAAFTLQSIAERLRRDAEDPGDLQKAGQSGVRANSQANGSTDASADVGVDATWDTPAEILAEARAPEPTGRPSSAVTWTPESLEVARQVQEEERIDQENAGLDLANTAGILPGGGMIVPEEPTPQQAAYIARRLGLMYKRAYADNLRKGCKVYPKVRPIRAGDLIP